MAKSFYDVGYEEGYAGKPERVPEGYHARMSYRLGWEHGDGDRYFEALGYVPQGKRQG